MSFSEVLRWFAETETIPEQLLRHMFLAYTPVLAALAVALPAGLYIGHRRRFEFATITLANFGRAVPSFAILSLSLLITLQVSPEHGLGFMPTFIALFFLSLPPILVNTHIGVKGVDADTVEAARGLGYGEARVLRSIELPLAAPLTVTGVKTAAVQSVATATLAAFVAGGGLGDYIRLGFRGGHPDQLVGGAILVAVLALATELVLVGVERAVRPKTRRGGRQRPSKVQPIWHPAQAQRPPEVGPVG